MKSGSCGIVSLSILLSVSLVVLTFVSSLNPIGTVNAASPTSLSSAVAIDPPTYVYLTLTASDPSRTIKVNWRTDENYIGQVRYGTTPGNYDKNVEGTGGVTTNTFDGYIHHVDLTGLDPDTVYYFICGNPDNGWSEELSFKTAPVERKDIRFVVGGDSRWDPRYPYPEWPTSRDNITKLMASYNPDFALFVGDYIWSGEYQGSDIYPYGYTPENFPDSWDNWLRAWYEYARTDSGRLIPFIPVMGNHEVAYPEPLLYDPVTEASNYYMLFDLPVEENRYAWYSLNWGPDLHITIFDSEILDTSSGVWNAQIAWFEQDLNQHLSLWNIAADHKPIQDFSSDQWTREFDVYHEDIVFSGHEHYYERSHPINLLNNQNLHSSASFTSPENGTIYVVSGGWGAPLNGGSNWYSEVGPLEEYHFGLVDIYENGALQFKAINIDNQIIDNFNLLKGVQPLPKGAGILILPVAAAIVVVICILVIILYLRR
jgi:hypothetical protein